MTSTGVRGTDLAARCHGVARYEGVAPALTVLMTSVLPDLLPCGPSGHAVVPDPVAAGARGVWVHGATGVRVSSRETTLSAFEPPGGRVRALATGGTTAGDDGRRAAFALGLVWLRLGLSEALRADCVDHLGRRRTGDSYVLQQQLVKGIVAGVLAEQLEVRAVLTDAGPGDIAAAALDDLQRRITLADREQIRLLGASGFLTGSPGTTVQVSELLADVYPAHPPGTEPTRAEPTYPEPTYADPTYADPTPVLTAPGPTVDARDGKAADVS